MLKELRITNIILVETADIHFASGFNVLSGETGSGKSALLEGLQLIQGNRADTGVIRRGTDKGTVEAVFEITDPVRKLLEEGGFDIPENEVLIRREISSAGKSRAYINHQIAQTAFLKKISELLFEISGQHAHQKLFNIDRHREWIDLFGDLQEEVKDFSKSWEEETLLKNKLDYLIQNESQRLRDIEVCRNELEEIDEANIKENEDESLFAEYTLMSHSEELSNRLGQVTHSLHGDKHGMLLMMNRQKITFSELVRIDPNLEEYSKSFQNAFLELEEIYHSLRNYSARIEHRPEKYKWVSERLTLISKLKKKYGSSLDEIHQYRATAHLKLDQLENTDNLIEAIKKELQQKEAVNNQLALMLTANRKQTALRFEEDLTQILRTLNMPKVKFKVMISPEKRSRKGDDKIEFYLEPNVGENAVPIKDCASGGELSRLMLALQTLLGNKECIPTLIFDEIDANIGGETARIVGQTMTKLGEKHQVLCITHFPQVAKFANHHIQISKKEKEGRTFTFVTHLDEGNRMEELERMQGASR